MTKEEKTVHQATGAILCCQMASFYLEEVKHTSIFKHSLKRSINNTIKELKKVEFDYYDKIDNIDNNEMADKLSDNLINFINTIMKDKLFIDFCTLQEILIAYYLEPKAIKGISDKIHKKNNAIVLKG